MTQFRRRLKLTGFGDVRVPEANHFRVQDLIPAEGFLAISATLAYLPPSKSEHAPALVAAFGRTSQPEPGVMKVSGDMVRAILLTLLKSDGSGKAGTGRDRIMVGPPNGWPIVLSSAKKNLLWLVVCEGIETGLSIHAATGQCVWAAGSAGPMPALADRLPEWLDRVFLVAEADAAIRKGALAFVDRLKDRHPHADLHFLADGEVA